MRWVLVLLVAGCGGHPDWPGEPDVLGADLVIESDADAHTGQANYRPYIARLLSETAERYGRDPSRYSGVRIVVVGHAVGCGRWGDRDGCYFPDENTIYVHSGSFRGICYEGDFLPHEALHYFIGDPTHSRPEWQALPDLISALRAYSICG